ncbi:histidinol-phosphatase [bacterium]|nr:histidinol-phosphatase [bacterium]
MSKPRKLFEYVGVMHIHTTDSDGSKTHDEIINMAQKYDLDFLAFSDHMTLEHKSKEGWYDKTLVIVGYEHQDKDDKNHYLVFGMNDVLPKELPPNLYVKRVKQAGGFGIIAHPDECRDFPKFPPLPWTDWSARDYDGIEIWNHMSAWLEGIAKGNKLKYLLNPRSLLMTPPKETLAMWDKINMKRRLVGIGSADAHGFKLKILWIFHRTIFPYQVELCSIRTHILTKRKMPRDFAPAKDQFFKTLYRCRAFISNYRWGDARGFRFWAENPYENAIIGDRIKLHPRLKLFVESPLPADIRLIYNGKKVADAQGKSAEFYAKRTGIYRVELYREGKGWIFSNHIRVINPMRQKEYSHNKSKSVNQRNSSNADRKSDSRKNNFKRNDENRGKRNR